MKKKRNTLELWLDETKMALVGIGMVLRRPAYVAILLAGFLVFAYIFAMFQDGTSTWGLLWSGLAFGDKIGVLGGVFLKIWQNFADPWGLVLNCLALMQGLNISLLIYGWRSKLSGSTTVAGLEAGGVGTAISVLALGCPSCGTSLLVPILTSFAGTGAAALADTLGWILIVVAAILLLHAARRLGYGAFIETTARRHSDAKG